MSKNSLKHICESETHSKNNDNYYVIDPPNNNKM